MTQEENLAMQEAHSLAQRGDLAGAARLCRLTLSRNPNHFYALYMLGSIELSNGRAETARALLADAVKAVPRSAEALTAYGNALLEVKRPKEAVAALDRALALQPQNLNALIYRGIGHVQLGQPEAALRDFDATLALSPRSVFALHNRANLLIRMNRHGEARDSVETLLKLAPNHVAGLVNHALLLLHEKRAEEALSVLARAGAIERENPDVMVTRGHAFMQLKRFAEALNEYDKAIALKPDSVSSLVARGNALLEVNRFSDALLVYERALRLDGECAEAHVNRANALMELDRLEEALTACNAALAAKPDYALAHLLKANVLLHLRSPDCFASYDAAIALSPDDAAAHYHRASALLLQGRLREGFAAAEHRWRVPDRGFNRPELRAPEWRGESLGGRTIVVFSEQGLGDTIQFARFLPRLAALGARVTFLCHAGLMRLFRSFAGEIEITDFCAKDRPFDFQCALLSLPQRLGIGFGDLPGPVPYVAAEAERAEIWRARLGMHGFKVGLAWQGNPAGKIDRGRSPPLAAFAPLFGVAGLRLISLQRHHGLDQLKRLSPAMAVETLGEFDTGKDAFIDTAAIMASLDLVITSDTAVAHLAGALKRPVWVALKHIPDWRWLLDRDDSPWYPSMRLFRQPSRGDWNAVFTAMAAELRGLVQSEGDPRT